MVRKLTAILAADIVGYSKLMGADQEGTLEALRQMRDALLEPVVGRNRGNIVKRMGDGWIVEFPSVTDAVGCAVTVQQSLAEHEFIRLRIGIHTGDVNFENDDVFGDGVNVASRLEGLADPGQILISDTAYAQLDERSAKHFIGGGVQTLKNIARPVTVWKWTPKAEAEQSEDPDASKLEGRTCIAVLPFDNMSGDPNQEYFSDGLTEDIITALSKHKWLEVVARNSVFAYKGTSPNVRRLADEVGADFVVEGSVRKSGDRVRVTAQLIDASSGNHVWAERYDRKMEDIFDVQDEITDTIVGRIEPEIGTAVRQKIQQAPRRDLQAWDCYHLGISKFYKFTAEGNKEAQQLLQKSRELEPQFAEAHAWWAYATILGMVYWDTEPDTALMDQALAAVHEAVSIDGQNAQLHMLKGRVQLARREYRGALADNETAIQLNPTLAPAYCGLGDSLAYEGRYDEAIALFEKAVAMSPNHPQLWAFLSYGAMTLLFDQQYEKALQWAERARNIPNCQYWATAHAAVALAYLGREQELQKMVAQLLKENADFTLTFAERKLFYLQRDDQLNLYLTGLEKAGIPR